MEGAGTLVVRFDDLIRCYEVLLDTTCEKEFLRYVANQDLCRMKWAEVIKESKRLKDSLDDANMNISNIDSKLQNARRMLDEERHQTKKIETERDTLVEQLENVKKILFADSRNKLPDETKEKLSFLRSIDRYSVDPNKLDTITEFDTTSASNLSDISYSRSEDDLDDYPRLRNTKKHRSSYVAEEPISIKRRRSSGFLEKRHKEIGLKGHDADHLVATTTVTVQHGGPISAKSVIEKFPNPMDNVNSETPKCSRDIHEASSGFKKAKYTPSAPTPEFSEPDDTVKTPRTPFTYESALDKINARTHSFIQKNVYLPETCAPCGSKIGFGNKLLKCTSCHIVVHLGCRDKAHLPCIPMGTPSKPGVMGFIHDYTPLVPPMIPALIIHCINEVEQRGLTEMGIYRVPGADKEVRSLKEKFLKGKGAPDLSVYDIHTVCSCLKDFLRTVQDSLIPQSSWTTFAKAVEKKDEGSLYQAISALPQPNRDTLAFIMLHLQRVSRSPHCKMPITNLAKVCAFSMARSPVNNDQCPYSDTHMTIAIVESLLMLSSDYWSSFIVERPIEAKTPATIRHTPSTESLMRKTSRRFLRTPTSSKKRFFTPYNNNDD